MNSGIIKRSVLLQGRKTSISLEDMFWHALKDIAAERHVSTAQLLVQINDTRGTTNMSSAVRQFVMGFYIGLVNEYRKMQSAASAPALGARAEAASGGVKAAPLAAHSFS